MVEPVACSMGVISPTPAFLSTLRALTSEFRSVLIFDETVSGFRVAPGGAAELYDVKPDLVCLGTILGGGMPIGAVGGRSDLVDRLTPVGNVSQTGTLSGNPIATAAGITTLRKLGDRGAYTHLRQYADEFTGRVGQLLAQYDQPVVINKVESLYSLHFGIGPVFDLASARACDHEAYAKLFHALLKQGVFIPPTGLSAWFVSTAHTREHLDITARAIERFLQETFR
jgi:glutamate-1-semialdehyde 2,1-aminomutase